jgi:hypothetical protein
MFLVLDTIEIMSAVGFFCSCRCFADASPPVSVRIVDIELTRIQIVYIFM